MIVLAPSESEEHFLNRPTRAKDIPFDTKTRLPFNSNSLLFPTLSLRRNQNSSLIAPADNQVSRFRFCARMLRRGATRKTLKPMPVPVQRPPRCPMHRIPDKGVKVASQRRLHEALGPGLRWVPKR